MCLPLAHPHFFFRSQPWSDCHCSASDSCIGVSKVSSFPWLKLQTNTNFLPRTSSKPPMSRARPMQWPSTHSERRGWLVNISWCSSDGLCSPLAKSWWKSLSHWELMKWDHFEGPYFSQHWQEHQNDNSLGMAFSCHLHKSFNNTTREDKKKLVNKFRCLSQKQSPCCVSGDSLQL